jgi:hypothetical protein
MQHRVMVTDDDKPIGAPVLPESRRDRVSVWIAEHSWVLPIIRIAGGLGLVAVAVLGFGVHYPLAKLALFVIGALSGGEAGEREKERGDTLLDAILAGGDPPEPPESLPREFDEFVPRPPDPRGDDRYFGRR